MQSTRARIASAGLGVGGERCEAPRLSVLDGAAWAAFLAGFQEAGQAAAILCDDGRINAMNARAQAFFSGALRLRDGRIAGWSAEADVRLLRLTRILLASPLGVQGQASAVVAEPGGGLIIVRGTTIAWNATGAYAGMSSSRECKAVITFMCADDVALPDAADLRDLFGLTASEVAVALAVAEGIDLRDIARRRGIAIDTVRSQLKKVFAKTNTRRQSALVALLVKLRGPPWDGRVVFGPPASPATATKRIV